MSTNSNTIGGKMATASRPSKTRFMKYGSLLSILLAPFARRFIAGVTLSEALDYVAKLNRSGFATTLDHLGEDVTNEEDAKAAAEQYVIMLRALKEKGLERNVSLKLSQMGLAINDEFCFTNLKHIVDAAEALGGFVRVDMEGSNVTTKTLSIVKMVKQNRSIPVGTVLQAMLKRTSDDVVDMLGREVTIRLCKGAYKEPKEVAYQSMTDIRREFLALTKRLLTSGLYHGIATHDPILIDAVKKFAIEQDIPKDKFEFQMLLGIRPSLQKKLVSEGWRVRIYVPFGRSWVPYTIRRLRERKENVWFMVKNLFLVR